jgi:hypothetical protein
MRKREAEVLNMLARRVRAVALCAGNISANCRPLMRSWLPPSARSIMAGNSQYGDSVGTLLLKSQNK